MNIEITTLLSVFVVLLVIGAPISIAIAISSLSVMFMFLPPEMALLTAAQTVVNALNSFSLLAIPLFILSGSIMNTGGLALRLINFTKLFTGKLPGPLFQINILSNMLFGALSGSAIAAEVAVGKIIDPLQKKENYDPALSAAVNIASCPTGLLIPPSNTFIVYSLVSGGTSIAALFLAGYLPGILMGLGISLVAMFFSIKENYPKQQSISFQEKKEIIIKALPSLLMIVIVIGGVVGGVFTATEGSGIAALYSLILSVIYKSLNAKKLKEIVIETVSMTGIVLFLISVSSIMSWVLSYSKIPQIIAEGLLSVSNNPIIIMLLINLILLCVGTFMDMTPAILIFTPIFLPIAKQIGFDPVHFGIIMTFNLCIGLCTPPVGSALFVGCSLSNIKIEEVFSKLIPMFIVLIITLFLIIFIPEISLFLPRAFGLM
ncbi:MAG: TRAP transporter large permease subunit [Spirochaetota bacterium]|nr:TRAP transporter large permease subunit [Spirochaetota bacterium]